MLDMIGEYQSEILRIQEALEQNANMYDVLDTDFPHDLWQPDPNEEANMFFTEVISWVIETFRLISGRHEQDPISFHAMTKLKSIKLGEHFLLKLICKKMFD
jgi:hypothetical protein